jgi:Chaperone of endosialidase
MRRLSTCLQHYAKHCRQVSLALGCFALCSVAQAVSPAPDGGYPGGNTAEGQNALLSLTTGTYNTAVGFFALESNTISTFNTAVGAGALLASIGAQNTGIGAGALLSNTTGGFNTASGAFALFTNTEGQFNTANGNGALSSNTTGNNNTANGRGALGRNATGADNTANGTFALANNITGSSNTAVGRGALQNCTGENNTAIGDSAGVNQTFGSGNIYIGHGIEGVAEENLTCRIGNIFGSTAANGSAVFITSGNKLGTDTSSKRFKEEIKPMDKASEALLDLKPVTFHYKREIDPDGKSQFGLVAEDVEKVNPDLIVRDKEGKPYSVRYDQVNAMLLNEFLKEHRKVQRLEVNAEQRRKEIILLRSELKEQRVLIQKVNDKIELTTHAPQTVATTGK